MAINKEFIKNNLLYIWLILAGIIIVFGAILFFTRGGVRGPATTSKEGQITETETRRVVPEGTEVPDVGAVVKDKEVAVPTVVTSAAPGVSAKLRAFTILADKGKFEPSKIVANKGDTINIVIEAVDGDYDFVLPDFGMMQVMAKGQKKVVEFQATSEGQFVYYCESCGGINSSAKGTITIVP